MKNDVIIIGLLALILGLIIGYFLAPRGMMSPRHMTSMQGHMEEYREHEDERFEGNGFMQHAMDEMMVGLRGKHGAEYEEAFLEMMVVHHLGAIEMAEGLLEETEKPELTAMANDIIEVQTAEVEMMNAWLDEWFKQ